MSAPVRFLALLVVAWGGIRAATLGVIPGFTVSHARPAPTDPPAIAATEFPPIPPVDAAYPEQWSEGWAERSVVQPPPVPATGPRQWARVPAQVPSSYYSPYAYPYMVPAAAPAPPSPRPEWQLPYRSNAEAPQFYTAIPPIDDWQVDALASNSLPDRRSSPVPQVLPQMAARQPLDRLQMSSWALLRGAPAPGALARGGTLGGSQAGARLTYAFNRWIAASVRSTSPIGGSVGAEIAGGVRVTPFRSIPLAITAERRQSISSHGGRSAFALFAEAGLYRQPMPLDFKLDAYLQAGVVGLKSRDYFADGAFAFTRPVYGRFSAGLGFWGGIQPGLYRVDAGPRISFRVRDNIHVHADWRQRLVGNAHPASGPALTLAADF